MSKHRMIDTTFWDDEYIDNLNPHGKLLYLFFLTNNNNNISGIYQLPVERIVSYTKIKLNEITTFLEKFEKDRKIVYLKGYIIILNFIKHQSFENPKILSGIKITITNLPRDVREQLLILLPCEILQILELPVGTQHYLPLKEPTITEPPKEDDYEIVEDEPELKLAKYLLTKINDNKIKLPNKPNMKSWAKDIRYIIKSMGMSYDNIKSAIDIAQNQDYIKDSFLPVVHSAKALREKYNKIFDYVERQKKKKSTINIVEFFTYSAMSSFCKRFNRDFNDFIKIECNGKIKFWDKNNGDIPLRWKIFIKPVQKQEEIIEQPPQTPEEIEKSKQIIRDLKNKLGVPKV